MPFSRANRRLYFIPSTQFVGVGQLLIAVADLYTVEVQLESLGNLKVETYQVEADADAAGKSLAQLQLRGRTGASVIAISRKGKVIDNPDPHEPIRDGDVLYLLGSLQHVRDAMCLLDTGSVPDPH